jgi:hypothetical protein
MGAIYENAWITIAATSSAGSTEHFLAPRPEEECNPIELNFVDASSDAHIIHLRQKIEPPTATPNPKMVMDIQGTLDGPLNKLAWTFQERELSRRVFHSNPKSSGNALAR